MRKSKLDNPKIKKKVVQALALEESQESIARSVGMSASQVCRFANREDIRKLIEDESFKLLEAVPDAVENVKGLVRGMKRIPKENIKRLELAYKASFDVLKGAGIFASPVTSIHIQNIYNQQNNTILNPIIQQMLETQGEQMRAILNESVDGELVEDNAI